MGGSWLYQALPQQWRLAALSSRGSRARPQAPGGPRTRLEATSAAPDTMSDTDNFFTADLHLAAFLFTQSCESIPPRQISERKVSFGFKDFDLCSKLALRFCSGSAVVEARAFIEAQGRARDLRDLCLSASPASRTQERTS